MKLRTRWTPSPCGRLSRPPRQVVTPATTTGPPPHPRSIGRQRTFPAASRLLAGEGTLGVVPTFTLHPFIGVGAQLCPCDLATPTPQTFSEASRPRRRTRLRESPDASGVRRAQPPSVRFELVMLLRDVTALVSLVHLPDCLPDPDHLTVLARPVVVGAALRLRPRSRVLAAPSFSSRLRPTGGDGLSPPHGCYAPRGAPTLNIRRTFPAGCNRRLGLDGFGRVRRLLFTTSHPQLPGIARSALLLDVLLTVWKHRPRRAGHGQPRATSPP